MEYLLTVTSKPYAVFVLFCFFVEKIYANLSHNDISWLKNLQKKIIFSDYSFVGFLYLYNNNNNINNTFLKNTY